MKNSKLAATVAFAAALALVSMFAANVAYSFDHYECIARDCTNFDGSDPTDCDVGGICHATAAGPGFDACWQQGTTTCVTNDNLPKASCSGTCMNHGIQSCTYQIGVCK
jgi:hypothetical protein